jgi:hypothetical protein
MYWKVEWELNRNLGRSISLNIQYMMCENSFGKTQYGIHVWEYVCCRMNRKDLKFGNYAAAHQLQSNHPGSKDINTIMLQFSSSKGKILYTIIRNIDSTTCQ